MTELVKVLMHRDGISEKEAQDIRREMVQRVWDGEDPEESYMRKGWNQIMFSIFFRAEFKEAST